MTSTSTMLAWLTFSLPHLVCLLYRNHSNVTSRFKVKLSPPRSLVQTTVPTLAVIVCPNRASGRTSDTSAYAPRTWRDSDQQPRCPTQYSQSPDCPRPAALGVPSTCGRRTSCAPAAAWIPSVQRAECLPGGGGLQSYTGCRPSWCRGHPRTNAVDILLQNCTNCLRLHECTNKKYTEKITLATTSLYACAQFRAWFAVTCSKHFVRYIA